MLLYLLGGDFMDLYELFEKLNGYKEENIDEKEIAGLLARYPNQKEQIIAKSLEEGYSVEMIIEALEDLIEREYDPDDANYNKKIRETINSLEEYTEIKDDYEDIEIDDYDNKENIEQKLQDLKSRKKQIEAVLEETQSEDRVARLKKELEAVESDISLYEWLDKPNLNSLELREEKLTSLEAEEKLISEAETLRDRQEQKQGEQK